MKNLTLTRDCLTHVHTHRLLSVFSTQYSLEIAIENMSLAVLRKGRRNMYAHNDQSYRLVKKIRRGAIVLQ